MTAERQQPARRRMPGEWEPHEATWLQWPNPDGASFPGAWTPRVEPQFVRLVECIAEVETVRLAVADEPEVDRIEKLLSPPARGRVEFHVIATREPWCRDIGPTYVLDERVGLTAVKWRFNGWGEQYFHPDDEAAGYRIAAADGVQLEEAGIVFEGGGVESDGRGTLMVTTGCLLDAKRNPGLAVDEAESVLRKHLGAETVIWIDGGVSGDDTGHTDVVARFVEGGVVAASLPEFCDHPDFPLLKRNCEHLRNQGREVITFPVPSLEFNNVIRDYLPKSYVNFYVLNEMVILPRFGIAEDALAHALAVELFPGREVCGFTGNDIAFGQGGVHCLTQQVPCRPASPTENVGKDQRRDDGGV